MTKILEQLVVCLLYLREILGCRIISGADIFLRETGLIHKIQRCQITVVCEGKFDKTSLSGKVDRRNFKTCYWRRYFLGGQYDYIGDNEFNGIYECGPKGLTESQRRA